MVGRDHSSFCNLVESRTKAWANIQDPDSFKFGVYYGKTKTDPTRKYRFTQKFGTNEQEAFAAVKAALLARLFPKAEMSPSSYEVRFDRENLRE